MCIANSILILMVGFFAAHIQLKYQDKSIKFRTFFILFISILFTVLIGYIFYQKELINSSQYYFLIMIIGIGVGSVIFFERLLLTYWWMIFIVGMIIAFFSYFLMGRNATGYFFHSLIFGEVFSCGYYLRCIIRK